MMKRAISGSCSIAKAPMPLGHKHAFRPELFLARSSSGVALHGIEDHERTWTNGGASGVPVLFQGGLDQGIFGPRGLS